jgi:hypothetical protein
MSPLPDLLFDRFDQMITLSKITKSVGDPLDFLPVGPDLTEIMFCSRPSFPSLIKIFVSILMLRRFDPWPPHEDLPSLDVTDWRS